MEDALMRMAGPALMGAMAGIDWIVVFTLAVVAVIYFLTPVLGYAATSRGMLLISMYTLVGYGVVVLLQVAIQYLCYLAITKTDTATSAAVNLGFLFALLKLLIFVAAEGMFVFGLKSLKRGV